MLVAVGCGGGSSTSGSPSGGTGGTSDTGGDSSGATGGTSSGKAGSSGKGGSTSTGGSGGESGALGEGGEAGAATPAQNTSSVAFVSSGSKSTSKNFVLISNTGESLGGTVGSKQSKSLKYTYIPGVIAATSP